MKRRTLLRWAGVGLPVAVAPALSTAAATAQSGEFASPDDLLAYGLNLKYVQAEFYRQGNGADLLSGVEADWLNQVGYLTQQHVGALTQALADAGATPPTAPATSFGDSFASRDAYLGTAAKIQDTVVRAYVAMPAAATFGETDVFRDMSGIFSVDARAAAVLLALTGAPVDEGVYDGGATQPLEPAAVLEALKPYIAGPWAMAAGAAITS
jgi:hypothetical protein